jgi:pilus assembly protein CpaB
MLDRRFSVVVLASLGVASASGVGVYRYLRRAETQSRVVLAQVLVAAKDLPEGHVITTDDARVVSQPAASVPNDAYRAVDSVVGRVTRIPVFTGEAMLPGRLAPKGAGAGLEVKIAPGKRAMAVKIDEVAGLSGLIQPNSRVDVLVTLRDDGTTDRDRAKLFMSYMRVLSIGSQIDRGPDGRPLNATTAALEVTPAEAEQLAVAANEGKIQLVLRGYGDPDTVTTKGASTRDVMQRLEVPPPPPPPLPVVEKAPPPTVKAAPTPRVVEPVRPPVTLAPPAPRPPDSALVQVYRRDKVTQQKFEKRDTIRRDSIRPDTARATPSRPMADRSVADLNRRVQ